MIFILVGSKGSEHCCDTGEQHRENLEQDRGTREQHRLQSAGLTYVERITRQTKENQKYRWKVTHEPSPRQGLYTFCNSSQNLEDKQYLCH